MLLVFYQILGSLLDLGSPGEGQTVGKLGAGLRGRLRFVRNRGRMKVR